MTIASSFIESWANRASRRTMPIESNLPLNGCYRVIGHIQASLGSKPIVIGTRGRCRYCCRRSGLTFRKIAHTCPEALGNKWITSLDECDECNDLFSVYEGALAASVAPLITIGGVKGKNNRVRQTGRSAGDSVLHWREVDGRPHISGSVSDVDFQKITRFDPENAKLLLTIPVAGVPFRPLHAYKALCKIAYALLPDDELGRYENLRLALLDRDKTPSAEILDVALSMASIGNAPPLVAGHLLKRTDPSSAVPQLVFLLSAGSVTLQIHLPSDCDRQNRPAWPFGALNILYTNIIGGAPHVEPLRINYGDPIHLDWTCLDTQPQPIEALQLTFDVRTTVGRFTPILRSNSGDTSASQ